MEKLATATVSNVVECCVPWVFVGSNGLGEEGRERGVARGSLAGHFVQTFAYAQSDKQG